MPRISTPASAARPIANAIRLAITAATLGAAGLVSQAYAQAPADTAPRTPATVRHYDIPAGPLPDALTRFSSQAGIYLAGATDLAKGRTSPGLQGDFSLQDGLAALLAGTGLQAVRLGNGGYGLREGSATPSEPAVSLRTTRVTAAEETDATTEGGGYAAGAVTMFGDTQSTKDIPSSVSVLTRQQMDDQNITTINDAMRYTTGVSSINYTGNNGAASAAYYNARGFPVDVALDGLSIVNGIQYMPQFDMAMYDRVEVFRGPSGLLNGQGDLGGSVNLVRKMPTDSFQFRSETSAGSWNNYREMIDASGPLNPDGTLRGRVVGVGSTGDSFLDREHSRESLGYGVLQYDIDPRTTVSLSFGYQSAPDYRYDWGVGYDSAGNLITGPRGRSQNFAPSWDYESNIFKEANASLKHRFDSGWTAEATVLYRQYDSYSKYAFALIPDAGTDIADYFGQRQYFKDDWLALDAHAAGSFTLLGFRNDVLLGASHTSMRQDFLGGSQDLGNYSVFAPQDIAEPAMPYTSGSKERIDQSSVYGHIDSHLTSRLSLVLGGRDIFFKEQSRDTLPTADNWNTEAKQNGKFVPYGGLILALTPQVSAYASYSEQFSAQTNTTYSGAAIQPFTGEQYEIGFKGGFLDNRLNATLATFRIDGDHLAVSDQLHPDYYLDSGSVRSQGWEAELSGSPLPDWNMVAGYTSTNTRYTSSPTDLGQSYDGETPRNLFKLWNTYHFAAGPLRGLMVGGGMYLQSNVWRLYPQYHQGGYATYSLKAGYQFNRHVEADVAVNNLLDKSYYDRAPYLLFAEYGAPRNVTATVRVTF